jgi:hypothetical protein
MPHKAMAINMVTDMPATLFYGLHAIQGVKTVSNETSVG